MSAYERREFSGLKEVKIATEIDDLSKCLKRSMAMPINWIFQVSLYISTTSNVSNISLFDVGRDSMMNIQRGRE